MALAALLAAAYHIAAISFPNLGIQGNHWRHGLFVVINLCLAVLLLKRPTWFTPAFAVLTIQQLYSHGGNAIAQWMEFERLAGISIGVCIFMPLTLALLIHERTNKTSSPPL